jgi:ubiquinone/menaquinone biosynthesis C-methylase UbiE
MDQATSYLSSVINKILRTFFYLLYHRFAWSYDFIANIVSIGMWNKWVLSILPEIDGPKVLELGHGPGHLQLSMAKRRIQTFGLDESKEMGILAGQRLCLDGFASNLVNAVSQNLPFETCTVHQVIATFPTEFIIEYQTLEEVIRILKPGGSLLVLPVAWITGDSILQRFAAWLFTITGQSPQWDDKVLDPFHRIGFTTRVKYKTMESSRLVFIIAEKEILTNLI